MSPKPRPSQEPARSGSSHHEKEAFWDSNDSQVQEEKKRVSEQISRLQQRQMDLVQQTAQELEDLKRQLEDSSQLEQQIAKAKAPLLQEVSTLQHNLNTIESEKKHLETQLEHVQQSFQSHHSQMQGTLDSLKNMIRAQARTFDQQIRVFSLDANQSIESLLSSVEAANMPVPEMNFKAAAPTTAPTEYIALAPAPAPAPAIAHTVALPVSQPAQAPSFEEHAKKLKEKPVKDHKPRVFSARKFAVRSLSFAILLGVGYGGYNFLRPHTSLNIDNGQVAGVSTAALPTSDGAPPDYKESQVDLPFAATEWRDLSDSDFGISIRYPSNTSNAVGMVGSDNKYFLRHDGYMLKLTKHETTETLDQWWDENAGLYGDYTYTKGTFKGQPAMVLKSNASSTVSSTEYIVKTGTKIMEVWEQNFPKDSDDAKRLSAMIDSLQFLK